MEASTVETQEVKTMPKTVSTKALLKFIENMDLVFTTALQLNPDLNNKPDLVSAALVINQLIEDFNLNQNELGFVSKTAKSWQSWRSAPRDGE